MARSSGLFDSGSPRVALHRLASGGGGGLLGSLESDAEIKGRRAWDFSRPLAGDFAPRPAPTIPLPTLLLRINRPWPVFSSSAGARDYHVHDGPCPECGGHQLPIATCCLVCHQSGVDHLLSSGGAPQPGEPQEGPQGPRGSTLPARFQSMAEWLE